MFRRLVLTELGNLSRRRLGGTLPVPAYVLARLTQPRFNSDTPGVRGRNYQQHQADQQQKQQQQGGGSGSGSSNSSSSGAGDSSSVPATTPRGGSDNDNGEFQEEAVVVTDDKGNSLVRVRREPLSLVEEVPVPQRVFTDIELILMAWSEEHAQQMRHMLLAVRISIGVLVFLVLYIFWRTQISSERMIRGVDNIPEGLRIGNVVYFDMTEDGVDVGRVVIGLLTEDCPLYCEYFHRRCTASGGNGDSFRGMHLAAMLPRHALIFGDGVEMTHDVPGFDPRALPTEKRSNGAWRGALSSICLTPDKETPNFVIHVSSGDYKPQVFGLIIGGYNVIERINRAGTKHGNTPKRDVVIEGCGELCTLAKSYVVPMPWRLYESVSRGYDQDRFGPRADPATLQRIDAEAEAAAVLQGAQRAGGAGSRGKRWWWPF